MGGGDWSEGKGGLFLGRETVKDGRGDGKRRKIGRKLAENERAA